MSCVLVMKPEIWNLNQNILMQQGIQFFPVSFQCLSEDRKLRYIEERSNNNVFIDKNAKYNKELMLRWISMEPKDCLYSKKIKLLALLWSSITLCNIKPQLRFLSTHRGDYQKCQDCGKHYIYTHKCKKPISKSNKSSQFSYFPQYFSPHLLHPTKRITKAFPVDIQ